MTDNLVIKTNSLFESVYFDTDSDTWYFYFSNNIYASSSGFWRLLKEDQIVSVSLDNGHQFGLPQPVNLEEEINAILAGKTLVDIIVNKDTSDLTLNISDNFKFQIFISSFGYETYEFTVGNDRYIGLGSGKIGIVVETDEPNVYTVRHL